jgi:hypothetical protein
LTKRPAPSGVAIPALRNPNKVCVPHKRLMSATSPAHQSPGNRLCVINRRRQLQSPSRFQLSFIGLCGRCRRLSLSAQARHFFFAKHKKTGHPFRTQPVLGIRISHRTDLWLIGRHLDSGDFFSLRAFRAASDLELDALAFVKRFVTCAQDASEMDENIRA